MPSARSRWCRWSSLDPKDGRCKGGKSQIALPHRSNTLACRIHGVYGQTLHHGRWRTDEEIDEAFRRAHVPMSRSIQIDPPGAGESALSSARLGVKAGIAAHKERLSWIPLMTPQNRRTAIVNTNEFVRSEIFSTETSTTSSHLKVARPMADCTGGVKSTDPMLRCARPAATKRLTRKPARSHKLRPGTCSGKSHGGILRPPDAMRRRAPFAIR